MARRFPSMRKVTTQKPSRIEAFRQSVAAIVNSSLFEFVAGILILLRPGFGESCFSVVYGTVARGCCQGQEIASGRNAYVLPASRGCGKPPRRHLVVYSHSSSSVAVGQMVHGMRFASGLHLFSSCCCCCWRRPLKLKPKALEPCASPGPSPSLSMRIENPQNFPGHLCKSRTSRGGEGC